jgi:pantetheine-phosphate adenylyltransferase
MIQEALGQTTRISVEPIDGLLVEAAKRLGCSVIVRGLRSGIDFEYEAQMTQMNRHLSQQTLDTIYLLTDPTLSYTSSSLIREVAKLGGDYSPFVSDNVAQRLRNRLSGT